MNSFVHLCLKIQSNIGLLDTYLNSFLLCRLRDEVRNIPCTYKSRNDAAADLIHIYAYTKNFFRIQVSTYIISTAFSFNYAF